MRPISVPSTRIIGGTCLFIVKMPLISQMLIKSTSIIVWYDDDDGHYALRITPFK